MKRMDIWIFVALIGAALWFSLIVDDDPASLADEEQVGPNPAPSPVPSLTPPPRPSADAGR